MQTYLEAMLIVFGIILLAGFYAFAWISLREHSLRAAILSTLIGTFVAFPFFLVLFLPRTAAQILVLAALSTLLLGAILFFAPIGQGHIKKDERLSRFDERDVVFARTRLEPGSKEYQSYYAMRSANLESDEKIRALRGLLSMEAQKADPLVFPTGKASFEVTEALREAVDGPVAEERIEFPAKVVSNYLRGLALHL